MEKRRNTILFSAIIVVAGSSYGFVTPAVKVASISGIAPSQFLPLQYLFALTACLLAMLVRKVGWGSPRTTLPVALLGVFTGCTSIFFYTSVMLLPSAAALTLLFQYVWIGILIECIAKRRMPSASSVAACIVVLVGTAFAAGTFDGALGSLDPIGVAAGAISAVFYALYLYFSGVIGAGESVVLRTTMLALGGFVVTSAVNPAMFVESLGNAELWPFAVVFGCIGILIPTALINFASPNLSGGMVAIMASSELPVGVLASWSLIGDTPTPLVLFGSMLVLSGILIKQLPEIVSKRQE